MEYNLYMQRMAFSHILVAIDCTLSCFIIQSVQSRYLIQIEPEICDELESYNTMKKWRFASGKSRSCRPIELQTVFHVTILPREDAAKATFSNDKRARERKTMG